MLMVGSLAVVGCTKKPTPEFESSVADWRRTQCSCYETSDNPGSCSKRTRPEAELGTAEQLMVNACVLTDKRRDATRLDATADAEQFVSACARGAVARSEERLMATPKIDFRASKIPPIPGAAAKR